MKDIKDIDNHIDFKEYFLKELGMPELIAKFEDHKEEFWIEFFKYSKQLEENKKESNKKLPSLEEIKTFYKEALPDFELSFFKEDQTRTECVFNYDNVPYCFSNLGNLHIENDPINILKQRIKHSLFHFELIKERHHDLVKSVYEYIKTKQDNVTCMVGGGAQIQVFFQNEGGYIAILYLSLDYDCDSYTYEEDEEDGTYVLQVNGSKNDILFEEDLNIETLTVRSHASVYGNKF